MEQIPLKFDLRTYCNSFKLDDDWLILLNFEHSAIFMKIFRFKIRRVFLRVDCAFFLRCSQCEGFCIYFVFVANFGFTDKPYLQLSKRFDNSIFRFHKHNLFALLLSNLCRGLCESKLLRWYQIAFPHNSSKAHSFGTIVDYESFHYSFLTCVQISKIKGRILSTLAINDISWKLNCCCMNINLVLNKDWLRF